MCLDSFLETVKNCDFSFAKYLNTKDLLERRHLNNYKISYTSTDSFFENKHGFSEKYLKENVPTLLLQNNHNGLIQIPHRFYKQLVRNLLNDNKCTFNVQLRGFKTDRTVKAELQRNPPFVTRVKNVFGLNQNTVAQDLKSPLNPANVEKLKSMLDNNDNSLTENEKKRIKIAFAEGYLLGNNGNTKMGRTQKYFKVFSQVITVFIFLAIIISLLASASGSVFR